MTSPVTAYDVVQGAVKHLEAQPDVRAVLGAEPDGTPWLFQHRLWVSVEASGSTAAVISRAGGWAGANLNNTLGFPRLLLELWADPIRDAGRNLADPGDTTCGFTAAKHDVAANPALGPLGANGGDTPTRLPGPTSPALDKIPAGTATGATDAVSGAAITLCGPGAKDQRDVNRPQGARCDIGSVEVVQVAPTVTGPNPIDLSVGVGVGTGVAAWCSRSSRTRRVRRRSRSIDRVRVTVVR